MPTINFDKLHQYIHSHGFTLIRTYTLKDNCFLLELRSVHTIQSIYLEMTNYECRTSYESYSLVECDESTELQIPTHLLESTYSDMSKMIELSVQGKGNIDIEDHIREKYKQHVILNEVETQDKETIQSIQQQLDRLQYAVRGIRYSIAIQINQHIGVILNDRVRVFKCDALKQSNQTMLYVTVDLDLFYDKIATIDDDCNKVLTSLETMLATNTEKHTSHISQLMQQRGSIESELAFLRDCNIKYQNYLKEYLPLVEEYNQTKQEKETKLAELRATVASNIHQEMKQSHQRAVVQKELDVMSQLGENLFNTVDKIRRKKLNVLLRVDKLVFNNIVLLDHLQRNVNELNRLRKQL